MRLVTERTKRDRETSSERGHPVHRSGLATLASVAVTRLFIEDEPASDERRTLLFNESRMIVRDTFDKSRRFGEFSAASAWQRTSDRAFA